MTQTAVIFDLDGTLIRSRLDFDQIRREIGLAEGQRILESVLRMPSDGLLCDEVDYHNNIITGGRPWRKCRKSMS